MQQADVCLDGLIHGRLFYSYALRLAILLQEAGPRKRPVNGGAKGSFVEMKLKGPETEQVADPQTDGYRKQKGDSGKC